jgi:DNA mismatch endonuclease (patch repair protein)
MRRKQTRAHVTARMRMNRSTGTVPELLVAESLRNLGIRYRSQIRRAGVRVDFHLLGSRVVVFVHGCFWHGCARHRQLPRHASIYWKNKIAANRKRDRRNRSRLRKSNYDVVSIWEHDIRGPQGKLTAILKRSADKRPKGSGRNRK